MIRPNIRHRLFVEALIGGKGNADAVYAAGYRPKSRRNAVICACGLLRRDDVRQLLQARLSYVAPDLPAAAVLWLRQLIADAPTFKPSEQVRLAEKLIPLLSEVTPK